MSLKGTNIAAQVLRGKIRSLNSISVDRSLSIDGASADAKAAGDGIAEAKRIASEHIENKANPHGVSKSQIGLSNVDNTSDMDKPVSYAQEEAIADAKRAGTEANAHAEEAMTAAGNAQTAADEAKAAADEAKAAADEAKAAAGNAQNSADGNTAWFSKKVTIYLIDWSDKKVTVDVPGVTENVNQPIIITPEPGSMEAYTFFKVRPVEQGVDTVGFSCETVPDCDITVNIVGFTVPKEV